jgi:hypothetical protein
MHKFKPGDYALLVKQDSNARELVKIIEQIWIAGQPAYTVSRHDIPVPEYALEPAPKGVVDALEYDRFGPCDSAASAAPELSYRFEVGDIVKAEDYGDQEYRVISRMMIVEESAKETTGEISYLVAPINETPTPENMLEMYDEDLTLVRRGLKKDVPEFTVFPDTTESATTDKAKKEMKHRYDERRLLEQLAKNRESVEWAKAKIDFYLSLYSNADDEEKRELSSRIEQLSRFIQSVPVRAYEIDKDEEGCE